MIRLPDLAPKTKVGRHISRLSFALLVLCVLPVFSQTNTGELRLSVTDPSGLAVRAQVSVVCDANQYRASLTTTRLGTLDLARLPFGIYQLQIDSPGFASLEKAAEIQSSIPAVLAVRLELPRLSQSVTVNAADTLIDPDRAGAVSQIGLEPIQNRVSSLPGRSLQDLVNSQPGWLYEGNAVLHPRGSEYQTQFVVDGIPLTDNRSPSFGPEIEAEDVQSISIYTAGIPAEYGRKMGGVIEVNTLEDLKPGLHGQAALSGGSFDTAGAFARGQYSWGKNAFGASASGSQTSHYLNPVVPQNYSNTGTLADFSAQFEFDPTPEDRLRLVVRHELSRYDLPNEQVQKTAGQRQTAGNLETMGTALYQHTFSSGFLADLRGMIRGNSNDFNSNPQSTPIQVFQHNAFREGYFKASATIDRGRQEWTAGVEADSTFLNENFRYLITDPTQFDAGTPLAFSFLGSRPDLEQAAFVQDRLRLSDWTVSAGLRWDHYQLLLNRQAVEPRLAISRYLPAADLVFHFSYDRVFQTPSFENLLLSSSPAVDALDPQFLRLPVQPSQGDYYEAGLTRVFPGKLKLDANYFRRVVGNYADDDQIENTTISFPISFRKAIVYGVEGKLDLQDWRRFSGYVSYSYTVGNAWLPVTGGLFLGDSATAAATQLTGHFPDSQDQRNTVRSRVRYQAAPRLWFAAGLQYDSGLPFQFDGDPTTALSEYGQQVLDRINFSRGRIDPSLLVNASAAVEVYKTEKVKMHLQADGENLTNLLDVIDFGGLFSGNAIGPSRSFGLRLSASF
jgi:hypothetical protein